MTHDVVWWEIETPDPAGAQAFYGALFGWTAERGRTLLGGGVHGSIMSGRRPRLPVRMSRPATAAKEPP